MQRAYYEMKIAIDESGDSGRKFWKGSSRFFIVSAVIVPDNLYCGVTCQAITAYRSEHNGGRELHFAHNSHEHHMSFLSYMSDKEYVFASIVIDKQRLIRRRPQVFRSKMSLLQFAFSELFTHIHPWLDDPIVLFDTNGPSRFNRGLSRHLMKTFGSTHKGDVHALKQVRSVDSNTEPLVQLADYVSGAIHHHVRDPQGSKTFLDFVEKKGKIFYVS
jgi:hypothetical protein